MPEADRLRWNARYASSTPDFAADEWLVDRETVIARRRENARALDLACGTGRNALYLATLGYDVDAWDISDTALGELSTTLESLRRGGESLAVHPRLVDLEDVSSLPESEYDLVLVFNYLQRSLFAPIKAALRSDGLLVIRALMQRLSGEDRNPAFLLLPGELQAAFADLELVEYQEQAAEGWAALVARQLRVLPHTV